MQSNLPPEILVALHTAIDARKLRSDSDMEDFAELHDVALRDVEVETWRYITKGTPCEGCKHVAFYGSGMYPCAVCARKNKDHYEPKTE